MNFAAVLYRLHRTKRRKHYLTHSWKIELDHRSFLTAITDFYHKFTPFLKKSPLYNRHIATLQRALIYLHLEKWHEKSTLKKLISKVLISAFPFRNNRIVPNRL
jgi:hypothetical protein